MRTLDQQNYYEILEVPTTASESDIHKAYLRAKQTYSPDSSALYTMFTEDEARELLKLIEEAYSVLGTIAKRSEYDNILRASSSGKNVFELKSEKRTGSATKSSQDLLNQNQFKAGAKENTDGVRRTRFGAYEVDPELESIIETSEVWDGALFRKIREYKKIPLDNLSQESRISKAYLISIENNDFEALPATVFVRGFIVQLIKLYGISNAKAVDSYIQTVKSKRGE